LLSTPKQQSEIKAVAFDLGGVVYESPLQAIVRYERKHNYPHNCIGKVIVQNGHNGAFAKLERGELSLAEFYPLVCPLPCTTPAQRNDTIFFTPV
jgi:hypothetical protein